MMKGKGRHSAEHFAGMMLVVGLLLLCPHRTSWAQGKGTKQDVATLAAELSRLRSEVEKLSAQVEEKKENTRSRLRSLSMQRANLDLSLQKARLQVSQIQQRRKKIQARLAKAKQSGRSLVPVVLKAATQVEESIQRGLPFRRKERLASLRKIARRVKAGLMRPEVGVAQLWQLVEDELRLGRENGLYTQVIHLQGKSMLVEVARLGMVMLFFKAKDGRVGYAARQGQVWRFVVISAPTPKEQIIKLFDALKKNIRTGFWTIPNPITEQK